MSHLSLDIHQRIATITFDNPPMSVMTLDTVGELSDMLPRLNEDDVGAVVITGTSDDYFVRSFSVEQLSKDAQGSGNPSKGTNVNMDKVYLALEQLPKAVITALNGTALGGGLELALATDIRVAKDGRYRFGLPEVSVGLLPGGGGTQRLSAVIGRNKALGMIMRAQLLLPAEALEIGLIDELVPADSEETALDRATAIAERIAMRPGLAIAHVKRLVQESVAPVTEEMLRLESKLFVELMRTPEAKALLAQVAGSPKKKSSK